MDYTKHYTRLVERARSRVLTGYTERHHIRPRCIGGGNEAANLVDLTAEEHYVAHQLLVKMYPGEKKLVYALWRLTHRAPRTHLRVTHRAYGWIKRELAEVRRQALLNESPEARARRAASMKGRTAHNKGIPLSDEQKAALLAGRLGWTPTEEQREAFNARMKSPETRAKMSAARIGKAPWNKGTAAPKPDSRPQEDVNAARSAGMREVWAARKAAGITIDNRREYAPLSEEHKARVAVGLKAAWASGKRSRVTSEEAKKKMRAAKLGRKLTDEHKRKISEAGKSQKGKQLSPEHLANLREAHAENARIRLIHKALHYGMV